MYENFVYVSHTGERFDGRENRVAIDQNDLRDYQWIVETRNNKITGFSRGSGTKKLPLSIIAKTGELATDVKNRLFELFESDVIAGVPGRIYIGDWYFCGFVTASEKKDYSIDARYCVIEATITTDYSVWRKDSEYTFLPDSGESGYLTGFDYPHEFPHDYGNSLSARSIVAGGSPSAYTMTIYGPAVNPAVTIDGHIYGVTGTVGEGELLTIDSAARTVNLRTETGAVVNWFSKRRRDYRIFDSIPAGQSAVAWNGTFGFDLKITEERSEPEWT